jgi:hypothetical protein
MIAHVGIVAQYTKGTVPLCIPQEYYFPEQCPSRHPSAWGLSCQVVSALRSYSFMGIYFVVSHFFSNFAAVIIL